MAYGWYLVMETSNLAYTLVPLTHKTVVVQPVTLWQYKQMLT